mgnify:CR=1 FL=1
MSCRRCPHHVRHGFAGDEGEIMFSDFCGLKIKKQERDSNPLNDSKLNNRKPVKVSEKKQAEPRNFGKLKKYPVKFCRLFLILKKPAVWPIPLLLIYR